MKKYFVAQIYWIPYEQGGRKKAPLEGTRYSPLIQFLQETCFEEWSIDFICPNFEKTNIIEFKFLADDAPYEILQINMIYGIYEGSKKVAQIKIIDCYSTE